MPTLRFRATIPGMGEIMAPALPRGYNLATKLHMDWAIK
jgi:hypothetical protein